MRSALIVTPLLPLLPLFRDDADATPLLPLFTSLILPFFFAFSRR